ncbi:MAG: A/G-specific adenine glycosylase, partial [Bacteroidales bacterium]
MNVSQSAGKWYDKNKRILPWREEKDPYCIWVSEIILQQTRMQQGIQYYHKFIGRFPDFFSLAVAPVEDVLKVWQGLGYYSRARNMHRTAIIVTDKYKGVLPSEVNVLKQLPGIGDYSAAAIASLAFDVPAACVDGNVYRLLSRYFGIETPIDSVEGKKEFNKVAGEILDTDNPGRHNQSMIELGALICLPNHPLCDECPLGSTCYAVKHNSI